MAVVSRRLIARRDAARVSIIDARIKLATPTYFAAVSSACSTDSPKHLLQFLADAAYPRVLVSAFDCARRVDGGLVQASAEVGKIIQGGGFVALDSGAFECQVLGVEDWSRDDFDVARKSVPHDLEMSFDVVSSSERAQNAPPQDEATTEVLRIQVVHGHDMASLIENLEAIFAEGKFQGVAIPDRELGGDLATRIRTLAKVRAFLDKRDERLILHVLGCGNPLVMAAFTAAGADTFDSLDWTQGAIDVRSLTFTEPTLLKWSGCTCEACTTLRGPAIEIALLHNLLFYQRFSELLRSMVSEGTLLGWLGVVAGSKLQAEVARDLKTHSRG